jgi:hypothetical protein
MVVPEQGVMALNRFYGGHVIPAIYPNFFCHISMTLSGWRSASWNPVPSHMVCAWVCDGGKVQRPIVEVVKAPS